MIFINILGKEARKKELKKNRKQRQLVRVAVLKSKDPEQILKDMEKLDVVGKSSELTLSSDFSSICDTMQYAEKYMGWDMVVFGSL